MVDTQGTKAAMAYSSQGNGDHVAIFVHGFLDAGGVWDGLIGALTTPNLQTVTFDLAGMGSRSADSWPISLERYAEEVGAIIEAIGKPAVIIAQSMGAQIAELAAAEHAALVKGLVLVTPVPLGGVKAPEEMVQPFKLLGGNPAAQRHQRRGLSPALSEQDLERLGQFGDVVAPSTVARIVNAWNEGHPAGAATSRFTGPVLIVRGEDDPFVTEAMANGIASRFPSPGSASIAGAGHWAHVERPEILGELTDGFLASIGWGEAADPKPASDWKGAFAQKSSSAFAEAFVEDVVLEATVLNIPVSGRENVKLVMAVASNIYEDLVFTEQASAGARQYIEWTAKAFGGVEMFGVTILTRNDSGQIRNIAIHHRPLPALLQFSTRLGESLRGQIDAAHFFPAAPHN